jgi:8-oxo-dGTP pyrophosphatase MutT (NUDIX family)
MENLHKVQMQILQELLFHPNARFTDLNISGLSNDHFSYHVRSLIELGFVNKEDGKYSLTMNGKEYANRIDTSNTQIEKQPKISVLIIPEIEIDGVSKLAVQQRLKEPYYGFQGFITGKIRYGETVFQAAARELKEEMDLEAEFEYLYTLHEMVYDKEGNMLEDKFFHVVHAVNVAGQLIEQTKDGKNSWVTVEEFYAMEKKYHNEVEILEWFLKETKGFLEMKYFIEGF